jgi:hypothetical protein
MHMSIHPETDIAETSYDAPTRTHRYTVTRNGKRWSATVSDDEFQRFGPVAGAQARTNQARRRAYLATKLAAAMQGEPDA